MNCVEAQDLLRLEIVGECPPAERELLEGHLQACPTCRAAQERLRPIVQQLDHDLADLLDREPRSRRRVVEELRQLSSRNRARRLWVGSGLAAAALLLLAFGLYFLGSRKPAPLPVPEDPLAGVAILWASPDAQWKVTAARQIELTAGELCLRATPAMQVITPAAVATAGNGIQQSSGIATEFFINVRPPRHAGPPGDDAMRWKPLVYVTVLAGAVQLTNSLGTATGAAGEALAAADKEAPKIQVENLARRFGQYYQPVKTEGKAKVPAYPLPLALDKVSNRQAVETALGLSLDQPSFKGNGFIVIPGERNEDIIGPYKHLQQRSVPIFITADTVLHLYHIQFDETLKDIEEREFYPDVVALTRTLVARLENEPVPANSADFREAQQKALTFLAIGLKALDPQSTLPKGVVAADVDQVLERMKKHQGFWPDPRTAHNDWPLFRYAEDFSQYVPRGHYTRSEALKKYFVGLMWYGRMTFLLKGDPSFGPGDQPALVSVPEGKQQTLAAALLTRALVQAELPDKRKARDVWERIYAVTSFYVGLADDLGVQEYQAALTRVCGTSLDLARLADDKNLTQLKAELAKFPRPAIYGGTGAQMTFDPKAGPEKLAEMLDKTAGFRFMGQRFVPDSHIMGKLVYPTVGPATEKGMFTCVQTARGSDRRGFPRGLDVMAVLGSPRARAILTELKDDAYRTDDKALSYEQALTAMKKEYSGLSDADWNRNLYWSWLHALRPLLADYGAGYPTFMSTPAYRSKSLNTALASWAQLRHDTILYAKQSYTPTEAGAPPPQPKPVQGYVEPLPEFYARMLTLSRMTNRGLAAMKVLDEAASKRLGEFDKFLERLLAISEKELANQELTAEEYKYIREIGAHLDRVMRTPDSPRVKDLLRQRAEAQKAKDFKRLSELNEQISQERDAALHTAVIADVHTDQNTRSVLEEGTGFVDLGIFVYLQPDGRLVAGAGPVMSYYEFKHPMSDRLTDEAWRQMLKARTAAPQPEWTKAYRAAESKYACPRSYSERSPFNLD
jgi:Protein of unknown function (DUF3160)